MALGLAAGAGTFLARPPKRSEAPRRGSVPYAGLTENEASIRAASDWRRILEESGTSSPGETVAQANPRFARTRCLHAGRWQAYWRVTFAGTSAIFESQKRGLLFCNRDTSVIEVIAPSVEH